VHQPGATGFGQELGTETDQPASWHEILHADPAGAVVDHLFESAVAKPEQLGDDSNKVFWNVDGQPFDRLMDLAGNLPSHYLWLPDGHLERLTAHRLNKDRQLEFATALHLPGIRSFRGQDSDGNISHQLCIQSRF